MDARFRCQIYRNAGFVMDEATAFYDGSRKLKP
jgi:hypothetical protein